jgi:hypothetical protein
VRRRERTEGMEKAREKAAERREWERREEGGYD